MEKLMIFIIITLGAMVIFSSCKKEEPDKTLNIHSDIQYIEHLEYKMSYITFTVTNETQGTTSTYTSTIGVSSWMYNYKAKQGDWITVKAVFTNPVVNAIGYFSLYESDGWIYPHNIQEKFERVDHGEDNAITVRVQLR